MSATSCHGELMWTAASNVSIYQPLPREHLLALTQIDACLSISQPPHKARCTGASVKPGVCESLRGITKWTASPALKRNFFSSKETACLQDSCYYQWGHCHVPGCPGSGSPQQRWPDIGASVTPVTTQTPQKQPFPHGSLFSFFLSGKHI